MLDSKYALKYKMPHSLLHIVDNSMYTGQLAPTVADDPSLYATIVVTGCPMGMDNRIVNLTRTDVASVAFGLGSINTDDIKRFGQSVEYPMSLLTRANAPVRFMRVTPEGSTYALSTIVVQWRWDEGDGTEIPKMIVRFKELPFSELQGLRLDRFKNTDRLNSSIIAQTPQTVKDENDETIVWNQRVFMNIISAGRGKAYNDMAFTIDLGTQAKRALNVRYIFSTINTVTTQVVETFAASLVNNNLSTQSTTTSTPLESVNVAVGRRVEGSSILVPYVNESAIGDVYAAYMNKMNANLNRMSEQDVNILRSTNVNTFDILFGHYIYNGDEYEMKLPYYQVEMYTADVKKLDDGHRFYETLSVEINPDKTPGEKLYAKLIDDAIGIKAGSTIHIGDLYLTSVTGYARPFISMVAAMNQYTGAITSMQFSMLKSDLTSDDAKADTELIAYFVNTDSTLTTAETKLGASKVINQLIANGTIQPSTNYYIACNDVYDTTNTVELYLASYVVTAGEVVWTITNTLDTPNKIRDAFVFNTSQTIVSKAADIDKAPIGGTLIDTDGAVSIKTYDGTATPIETTIISVGACPAAISITDDKMGVEYDILWNEGLEGGTIAISSIDAAEITAAGTGYAVDDILKFSDAETPFPNARFKVTSVGTNGEITGISIEEYSADTWTEAGQTLINTNPQPAQALGYADEAGTGTGATIRLQKSDYTVVDPIESEVQQIKRWMITGSQGSLYRIQLEQISINADYYTAEYGINPTAEMGGIRMSLGSTGFFDDTELNSIEFKYLYSALLVQAYRGQLDPRILSPNRCSAKYLFDGGTNTVVSQTILPNTTYTPIEVINASTIFTEDEKDYIIYNPDTAVAHLTDPAMDIDVKQAMYDLMIERVYLRIPETKRPLGPGYGLSLHLDAGVTDATTVALINTSFSKRFTNPNASWDIGGFTSSENGITYTFMKNLVDNLIAHCKQNTVNKPYAMTYATINSDEYTSYFPNIDMTDWELRDYLYGSGGNVWVPDVNGNLMRRSQRTMQSYNDTSDLIQESNMRTLSQLCYLLQNKIDSKLLEYDDDDTLKTLSDEINVMFQNWRGNLVQDLEIFFERDINPTDGGDIVVCYCNVTFRGLILRVPIIVNIQRRVATT